MTKTVNISHFHHSCNPISPYSNPPLPSHLANRGNSKWFTRTSRPFRTLRSNFFSLKHWQSQRNRTPKRNTSEHPIWPPPTLQSSGKTLTQVVCMCGLNHVILLLLLLLQSIPFTAFRSLGLPHSSWRAHSSISRITHKRVGCTVLFCVRGRRCW